MDEKSKLITNRLVRKKKTKSEKKRRLYRLLIGRNSDTTFSGLIWEQATSVRENLDFIPPSIFYSIYPIIPENILNDLIVELSRFLI